MKSLDLVMEKVSQSLTITTTSHKAFATVIQSLDCIE